MPQFELTPYLSQAFWMLISFGFLYLIVSYLIFPLLEDVFTEREALIKTNLETAAKVNERADELVKNYNAYIYDAQQQKALMIKQAFEDMHQESIALEKNHDTEVREKLQAMENNLKKIESQLHTQSDAVANDIAQDLAGKFFSSASSVKKTTKKQGA